MRLALSAEDYIELLPVKWRAINHYGVKIDHRVYESKEPVFADLRRQDSGNVEHKGLWEIHYDPYDVTRIWLRNTRDAAKRGWITLFWKFLHSTPAPFGELAWDHALAQLRAAGNQNPTQAEIAAAVAALLRRAHQGPAEEAGKPSKRDKRVAARTLASPPALPRGADASADTESDGPLVDAEAPGDAEDIEPDEDLADVIPLEIYDAREEAKRWW